MTDASTVTHAGEGTGIAADGAPVPAPAERPTGRPVRLGLLLDELTVPAWAARALRRLVDAGVVEIALVVLNEATAAPAAPAAARRGLAARVGTWYRNRDLLAYALYHRLDRRRYARPGDPGEPVDLSALLRDVPVVRVRPRMTRFCDYFEDADLARIAEHDLDVALRLGFRILKGGALDVARHGVWSFHHGDNRVNRGGPAGFWEVAEQHPATGAVLQRLTEDLDGGEILGRSFSSTNRFSPTANRANYYWQASELLVSRLHELAELGSCSAEPAARTWSAYSKRLYVKPRTREVLAHALRVTARLARSRIRALLVREQWLMAFRLSPARGAAGDVPDGVFYRFRELQPPPDRFWADPFPVHADGRHYLFFEEMLYGHPHAHVCVVEMGASGMQGQPVIALRRPYHLSYPAVFRWQGAWYMTPETVTQRAVELYRATEFPERWEHVGNLVEGIDAVDPTIACIQGRWWMFVGVMLPGVSEATALHLYSAPSPLGPWTPHRRNPVKIDVRGARPGGRVFEYEGRHYRVGQDGAPRYGSGLRVYAIERLDDGGYREVEVSHILPEWGKGLVGTHTLNASGGLTAIDVRRERRKLWPPRPPAPG